MTSFPKEDLTPVASDPFTDGRFPPNVDSVSSHDIGQMECPETPTSHKQ